MLACHAKTMRRWVVVPRARSYINVRGQGRERNREREMTTSSFNFAGKVALVTGGSSGIGKATAILFARYGAKVVIGDVNPAGVETAEMIKREQGQAIFIQTDVSVAEEMKNLVAAKVKTFGGLEFAVYNTGGLPPSGPFAEHGGTTLH